MTMTNAESSRRPSGVGTPRSLLDISQAAERLSISHSFVRRLVLERRIPYFKVGKYIRFEAADLDAWLAARRVEPIRRA